MAGIARKHGQVGPGAWYGYSPLVVKIANTGAFSADTIGVDGAITNGGYTTATMVLETVASIVWLGTQDADSLCAVVDFPSANQGDGTGGVNGATTGFGALKDALAAAMPSVGPASQFRITTATALNGAGTFTFA
jgi:hypothetical protein